MKIKSGELNLTKGRAEWDMGGMNLTCGESNMTRERVEHNKGRVEHDKGRDAHETGRWALHTVGQHTQEVRTLEAALLKWNPLTQRIPSTTKVSTYLRQ